jgi:hypothetical protein
VVLGAVVAMYLFAFNSLKSYEFFHICPVGIQGDKEHLQVMSFSVCHWYWWKHSD